MAFLLSAATKAVSGASKLNAGLNNLVKAAQSEVVPVETIIERVSNSVLPDVRRAAVLELKDVSENSAVDRAFGERGVKVLADVLRHNRDDSECMIAALETLRNIMTPADGPRDAPYIDASRIRYLTIQVLTTLLQNDSALLQAGIVASPLGIPRLMDMLSDRTDVIRNESLLLLIALTRNNAEIQKIVAFENAFERLLDTVREEGGTDGGVIVHDCLQLIANLLRNNTSNQVFFRETGCAQRLPPLLATQGGSWLAALTDQKASNATLALHVISLLVTPSPDSPSDSNTSANKALLAKLRVVEGIADIALAPPSARLSHKLQVQALRTLAAVIAEHAQARAALDRHAVGGSDGGGGGGGGGPRRRPVPALVQLTLVTIYGKTPSERAAALSVFRAYLRKNAEGQLPLASTLNASGMTDFAAADSIDMPDADAMPLGRLVVGALLGRPGAPPPESGASAAAGHLLAMVVAGNQAAADAALRAAYDVDSAETVFARVLKALPAAARAGDGPRAESLLRLAAVWCSASPAALAALLSSPPILPLLRSPSPMPPAAGAAGSGLAAPLAALLLSACVLGQPGDPSSPGVEVVLGKIGMEAFSDLLEALERGPLCRPPGASASASASASGAPQQSATPAGADDEAAVALDAFDPALASHVAASSKAVRQELVSAFVARPQQQMHQTPGAAPASSSSYSAPTPPGSSKGPRGGDRGEASDGGAADAVISHYKQLIRDQDAELRELRAKVAELQSGPAVPAAEAAALKEELAAAREEAAGERESAALLRGLLDAAERRSGQLQARVEELQEELGRARASGAADGPAGAAAAGGEAEAEALRARVAALEGELSELRSEQDDLLCCLAESEEELQKLREKFGVPAPDAEAEDGLT
eukprot:tig00020816_g14155.t1